MPTYTAKCSDIDCRVTTEYQAPITHEESPPCRICGGVTKQVWTKPEGGFILKGKGWAKDGYSK